MLRGLFREQGKLKLPPVLGASIHDIITQIKSQPSVFTSLKFYYTPDTPLTEPSILELSDNGIRLRFDGPDQRLRSIEVTDFTKSKLVYKDITASKPGEAAPLSTIITSGSGGGPSFKHVYDKLLGPTFPGEYSPPQSNESNANGTYLLSYPGVAFCFPVRHSAYSPSSDFIHLLSSSATYLATSMLVFHGESWPAVRDSLYTSPPPNPRSSALAALGKGKDEGHDEIELAKIHGEGRLELVRRSGGGFEIILGETTAQDLITELGAPDAIHWKSDRRLSIHKERTGSETSENSIGILASDHDDSDSNHSSLLRPDLDDVDIEDNSDWEDDEAASEQDEEESASAEHFYNYFSHGFDILLAEPRPRSTLAQVSKKKKDTIQQDDASEDESLPINQLAATKIIFHGNIPGSYQFNRYRRSRWTIEHVPAKKNSEPLTSEMPYADISARLKGAFMGTYENHAEELLMQRGMAINRGWGDSPGSSCELLGGFEESTIEKTEQRNDGTKRYANSASEGKSGPEEHSVQGLGSTMLFGFPGLIFEVMENDLICTLTVY